MFTSSNDPSTSLFLHLAVRIGHSPRTKAHSFDSVCLAGAPDLPLQHIKTCSVRPMIPARHSFFIWPSTLGTGPALPDIKFIMLFINSVTQQHIHSSTTTYQENTASVRPLLTIITTDQRRLRPTATSRRASNSLQSAKQLPLHFTRSATFMVLQWLTVLTTLYQNLFDP